MLRRIVLALTIASLSAGTAAAQFPRGGRVGPPVPDYWVGLSDGLLMLGTMNDGPSSATWSFGYSNQIAATLDKTFGPDMTIGALIGFASPKLTYTSSAVTSVCTFSCTASANATQYLATGRFGRASGYGFSEAFVIEGGVTQFSHFRVDSTGTTLPGGGHYDATIGTGFELGGMVAQSTMAYFATNLLYILHQQGTVQSTPPVNFTIKVGLREGF